VAPSFTAAWTAAAALTAAYAPAAPPEHPRRHALGGPDPASDALAQAARHGDEHVLKFTDTAVEVYLRTSDTSAPSPPHSTRPSSSTQPAGAQARPIADVRLRVVHLTTTWPAAKAFRTTSQHEGESKCLSHPQPAPGRPLQARNPCCPDGSCHRQHATVPRRCGKPDPQPARLPCARRPVLRHGLPHSGADALRLQPGPR
jgi:hypothetical protein